MNFQELFEKWKEQSTQDLFRADYTWLGIELHAFLASSLESDNQFVIEVLRTGIEI
jgi:hypothetical protein